MKHVFIMAPSCANEEELISYIKEIFNNEDFEIIKSEYQGHASEIVKQYKEPTRFYSLGGDGMLNQVIQKIVHTDHQLVVVPTGTGNDFARMLDIPKNFKEYLKNTLILPVHKVDTIKMNEHYYINSACFGVDSVIANHVHDIIKIPLVPRSKSYIVSILQNVFSYPFDNVHIESEGKTLFEGPVTLCTMNNGAYYGGGFFVCPKANIQDGWIDITVVEKIPKWAIPYYFILILRHTFMKKKKTHTYRVKTLDVYAHQSINMDGEEENEEDYHFEIQPLSINIVY